MKDGPQHLPDQSLVGGGTVEDSHDLRIRVLLEPREKVATTASDVLEELEVIVPEVEEQELALYPITDDQLSTVVSPSVRQLHTRLPPALDAHNGVELGGGGSGVRSTTWEELRKSVVEFDHGRIGDHHVLESVETLAEFLKREPEFSEGVLDRRLQELDEPRIESIVERRRNELGAGRPLVRTTQCRDVPCASDSESEDKRPEERHSFHLSLALDEFGGLGERGEPLIGEETLESLTNAGRLTVGHDPSTFFCFARKSVVGLGLPIHHESACFPKR